MSNDYLAHYGTPRHSGRYPWGSGDNPYQHNSAFLRTVKEMEAQGKSEKEIAASMGMKTTEFRNKRSIYVNAEKVDKINKVMKLKEKGYSNTKIAEMMFDSASKESTVRSLISQGEKLKKDTCINTADMLAKKVGTKNFVDIGTGTEREIGITKTRMDVSVQILKEAGYEVHSVRVPQINQPGQYTTTKVLCPPGTEWKDVQQHTDKIQPINEYSHDGGVTFWAPEYPSSISSNRVAVRYGDKGGLEKDGVIELRRGIPDLDLGDSHYAQVRIAVDGTHYLKGMAIYSDDMPKGVDVVFNTNKTSDTPKMKVFKEMKNDPDNPFGATIKANGQYHYKDKDGNDKLGAINKLKEEGDWDHYSKNLASQFLSKQQLPLIKKQLKLSVDNRKDELDSIIKMENPVVKKKLLADFAEACDSQAVDLKAAALPRQSSKVILPVSSLKDNEIYAPSYKNGETVCLVRYPHGGPFEIPELKVNNKNPKAKSILGNAIDAVGINSKVAERLSGADFDGDSVVVIPSNSPKSKVKITTSDISAYTGLKDFDPKIAYRGVEGITAKLPEKRKGLEMGKISNLITDMTLKGAQPDEIARAVRHSMVVIDAPKHGLDYKRSYEENGIAALKKTYQGREDAGASTLLSRAKSETRIAESKQIREKDIDPKTGEVTPQPTGRTYTQWKKLPDGTYQKVGEKEATIKTTKMAATRDARTLLSINPNPKEVAYADYANELKGLANQARKEMVATKNIETSTTAKKIYAPEVASLNAKLNRALLNAPRERQAQIIANKELKAKKANNPDWTSEEVKRAGQQALTKARAKVEASKSNVQVDITEREWKAIQSGALSTSKLSLILNNADSDKVKQLASPKQSKSISAGQISRIKSMLAYGYTQAEIHEATGVSISTINEYV
ncbi:MAG TPA: phage tail protein [Lachnospiraceae bacterium]|nr:phage tail protein [Lachnospiraceae bacterium]